eukprot:gene14543-17185_t
MSPLRAGGASRTSTSSTTRTGDNLSKDPIQLRETVRALQREREELMNKLHNLTNLSNEKDVMIIQLNANIDKLRIDLKVMTLERDTHRQKSIKLERERDELQQEETGRLKQRVEESEAKAEYMNEKFGQLLTRYQTTLTGVESRINSYKQVLEQSKQEYLEMEKLKQMFQDNLKVSQQEVLKLKQENEKTRRVRIEGSVESTMSLKIGKHLFFDAANIDSLPTKECGSI